MKALTVPQTHNHVSLPQGLCFLPLCALSSCWDLYITAEQREAAVEREQK